MTLIMKKILLLFVFSFYFYSCDDDCRDFEIHEIKNLDSLNRIDSGHKDLIINNIN